MAGAPDDRHGGPAAAKRLSVPCSPPPFDTAPPRVRAATSSGAGGQVCAVCVREWRIGVDDVVVWRLALRPHPVARARRRMRADDHCRPCITA